MTNIPNVAIGRIKYVDRDKRQGVILQDDEQAKAADTAEIFFKFDDANVDWLQEGQLGEIIKEQTKGGPQAKQVTVLSAKQP